MKTYEFNSIDELDKSGVAGDYEALVIIDENGWIKSDLQTECKSWKIAVRRFFKALKNRYPEIASEWEDCVKESVEWGCWKCNDFTMGDGSLNEHPGYSFEVEKISENNWYVYLNVRKDR